MDTRKLILFGKNSFVVSVPKSWVEKNKLKKSDAVSVKDNGNELVFSANEVNSKKDNKEIVIEADDKEFDILRTQIVSAYINNYNNIIIKSKKKLDNIQDIRQVMHNLVAMEVMEQTKDKVSAKDFLNYNDASVKNLIRRIDVIARSMLIDSIDCLHEDKFESVYHRDHDVNRLTYLAFRVIKSSLSDPSLAKRFELTNPELLDAWVLVLNLEKIADGTKRVARLINEMRLNNKRKAEFKKLYENINNKYLLAMKSYHTINVKLAFDLLSSNKECIKSLDKFAEGGDAVLCTAIDMMKGMRNCIKEISKLVINSAQGEKHGS